MTSYIESSDLLSLIPDAWRTRGTDDNRDGIADALTAVLESASDAVDAGLNREERFSSPYPAIAKHSARIFAMEMLYLRRGHGPETNPFSAIADKVRDKLSRIASGLETIGAQGSSSSFADATNIFAKTVYGYEVES